MGSRGVGQDWATELNWTKYSIVYMYHSFPCYYIKKEIDFCALISYSTTFLSVQSLSHVWLCDLMDLSTPGFPVQHHIPDLAQTHSIELVMQSNHLILCRPLLLLPPIFPAIRVFSNESVFSIRWPKYWSFKLTINPTNEYSGLISFRIDWFALLVVQGTLKSLLQHHSSKISILYVPTLTSIHDY